MPSDAILDGVRSYTAELAIMGHQRSLTSTRAILLDAEMLDKSQLANLFDRLGTPPAGRQLVLDARAEAPVRPVKSQGGNVITVLASQKMG